MVDGEKGTLFVVSTPIGNMGDFSFRGAQVLQSVSLILAEDTRHARKLLSHFSVTTPVASYHEHNEARVLSRVLHRLEAGEDLALICDAGTPLLSDPGERLVSAATKAGVSVNAVPGASALLAALVVSGFNTSPFTFYGFPPRKGAERTELLRQIAGTGHTIVLFEAANRLVATLEDLMAVCSEGRQCAVARELTKKFEDTHRGTLAECAEYYKEHPPRGEVVLLLAGAHEPERGDEDWRPLAAELVARGLSTRDVVSIMVKEHGAPRNVAYRLARES
jgi:16S rRNA (cytidine1402-2'-O)-methyltransferase